MSAELLARLLGLVSDAGDAAKSPEEFLNFVIKQELGGNTSVSMMQVPYFDVSVPVHYLLCVSKMAVCPVSCC